jgi:DNA-binding beta-propeller fold protein YncE
MHTHRRWCMLRLTGVVLADSVAEAQAAADLTALVFVTTHNFHELAVMNGATDRILTRLPVGNQPHIAVISPAGKGYTIGTGTDTAPGVNNAALLHSLLCADSQDVGEVAVIDSTRDTNIP